MADDKASFDIIKEQLIRCVGGKWRSMLNTLGVGNLETGVVSHLSINNCEAGDEAGDGGDIIFLGSNIDAIVEDAHLANIALDGLEGDVKLKLDDPIISTGVSTSLDEELGRLRIDKYRGPNTPLNRKAFVISYTRMVHKLKRSPRNEDTEFKATLVTLIGGFAGNPKFDPLHFAWHTQWPCFLETLQRETKGSTIPPSDLFEMHYWPELREVVPLPGVGSTTSSFEHAIDKYTKEIPDITDNSNHAQSTFLHKSNQNGYTLDHGPWLYQIYTKDESTKAMIKEGGLRELRNTTDFERMVADIKKGRMLKPQKVLEVLISHYMDRAAQNQWRMIQTAEAEAELQFCHQWGMIMPNGDVGVPYREYLAEKQNRQAQTIKEQQQLNVTSSTYIGCRADPSSQGDSSV